MKPNESYVLITDSGADLVIREPIGEVFEQVMA